MPLQAVKLPISRNNVVGENTVLQLNSLQNVSVENLQFSPVTLLLLTLHVVLMAMVQYHKLRTFIHQFANKLSLKPS